MTPIIHEFLVKLRAASRRRGARPAAVSLLAAALVFAPGEPARAKAPSATEIQKIMDALAKLVPAPLELEKMKQAVEKLGNRAGYPSITDPYCKVDHNDFRGTIALHPNIRATKSPIMYATEASPVAPSYIPATNTPAVLRNVPDGQPADVFGWWEFSDAGDGSYFIRSSRDGGAYLTAESTAEGAEVYLRPFGGGDDQRWVLMPGHSDLCAVAGGAVRYLASKSSGKCLHVGTSFGIHSDRAKLMVKRSTLGYCEDTFSLWRRSPDLPGDASPRALPRYGAAIALRSAHGKYLVAHGTEIKADRDAASTWETFTVYASTVEGLRYGDRVALFSFHNRWVRAHPDGVVDADAAAQGPWEIWTLVHPTNPGANTTIKHGDLVALRSSHGKYLVAEPDTRALADRDKAGPWEQWKIEFR